MNENAPSAPGPESGSQSTASGQAADASSSKPEQSGDKPSIFERLTSFFRQRNGSTLREDIADAIAESAADEEVFSPGERAMLNNILRLREVRVEDVMVPRADVRAAEMSTTLGQLLLLVEDSGHSRIPVYVDNLDDPRGMVHIRDVVTHITQQSAAKKPRPSRRAAQAAPAGAAPAPAAIELDLSNVDLSKTIADLNLIRNVLFVPPSMLASDLMAKMQASRTQIALVIDEYGGTDGLVSLEDIVEMIVGDIEDEHDDDEMMIVQSADGAYLVDGKAEIDDVAAMIGNGFSAGEHSETVDTIGGLVLTVLGRVPVRGEIIEAVPGFTFQILDADPRRVKRVRISPAVYGDTPAPAWTEPLGEESSGR